MTDYFIQINNGMKDFPAYWFDVNHVFNFFQSAVITSVLLSVQFLAN
jgi:hypothetical protein